MNVFWILPLIILFGCSGIIAIIGRFIRKESETWNLVYAIIANVALLVSLGFIIYYFGVPSPTEASGELSWHIGNGFGSTFKMDDLTKWLMLVFTFLGSVVAIYSIRYMDHDDRLDRYYLLLLVLIAGMIGVVMAGDLFTLFVFWETMSIASYVLVAFRKEQPEPVEAGIKYLFMSAFGSVILLFGFSLIYGITGTLNISSIGSIFEAKISTNGFLNVYYVIVVCLIIGFGVKAAIVPLHTWLPDAHPAAPSGISAMLSGVVIMTGTYGMFYTLTSFFKASNSSIGFILLWLSIITMIVGNLLALRQTDIKRLFAFSTVLNVGFIFFGLSMALTTLNDDVAALGAQGAWFHIFTHALGKGLAFMCAGAILYRYENRNIESLEGIGKKMPWTVSALTLALLSLAGIPPLPGFWSKLNMVVAAIDSNNWQFYAGAALFLLSSVISVVYYLILLQRLWFKEPGKHLENVRETPVEILMPLYVIVIVMIVVSIIPGIFSNLANDAAQYLL